MGTYCAVPYVSLVEVCTTLAVPAARAASSTLSVPFTLVATYEAGAAYEYGIPINAARW